MASYVQRFKQCSWDSFCPHLSALLHSWLVQWRSHSSSLSNPSAKRASLLKSLERTLFGITISCLHLPIPWLELEGGKDGGGYVN